MVSALGPSLWGTVVCECVYSCKFKNQTRLNKLTTLVIATDLLASCARLAALEVAGRNRAAHEAALRFLCTARALHLASGQRRTHVTQTVLGQAACLAHVANVGTYKSQVPDVQKCRTLFFVVVRSFVYGFVFWF